MARFSTMRILLLATALMLPVCAPATAQPETAPLVVMNLAAHPDDEDGSTLAYYRQGRDAIAYSVIYTRGEGGQNQIGPELYEELGALRTEETLRAARHLGTQVYFLNFMDFGFSKSAEETFERWGGRDEVTSRIVYLIRKLKPDVLFTNHDTVTVAPNAQHGHHQVVGLTAYDAFELAADPTYHPEQVKEDGVDLWQPKRLFHRLWSASGGRYDVAVPVGRVDGRRDMSYAAMAAMGLHEHASQGMDMFADMVAGWDATYFVNYRNDGVAPPDDDDLAANLPDNHAAEPDVGYWIDSGRIARMPSTAVTADDTLAVPGQRLRIHWNTADLPARPIRLRLFGAIDTTIVLREDSPPSDDFVVHQRQTPTIPRHVYQYEHFKSTPPLGYAVYDARSGRLEGGGYVPLDIAPPLSLEASNDVVRLSAGANVVPYTLRVFDDAIESVTIAVALSNDAERIVIDQNQSSWNAASFEARRGASVRLPDDAGSGAYTVSLSALAGGGTAGPATADDFIGGRVFETEVPTGLRVGVIESYDNSLADALKQLDVDYVLLDSAKLADAAFDELHTIVVDIRAYLVRRDLRQYNDTLLAWVRRGGHLIVNYQKTYEWNADLPDPFDSARNNPGNFAPYPIELSHDRVTRESARVTLLHPDHPILTTPNTIRAEDWDGWVQERGLYFPGAYDDRYIELFSLHDPGERPLRSSTLLADVGDGTYLFTALVWYRQLKVFHPGAYKIFANMISLPFADGRMAGLH